MPNGWSQVYKSLCKGHDIYYSADIAEDRVGFDGIRAAEAWAAKNVSAKTEVECEAWIGERRHVGAEAEAIHSAHAAWMADRWAAEVTA